MQWLHFIASQLQKTVRPFTISESKRPQHRAASSSIPKMASHSTFLGIPVEVRVQIYCEYASIDGGYVYNPASGKLQAADGGLSQLSLMSTCRQVAAEFRSIPLAVDTVTFTASSSCSTDAQSGAGRFDAVQREQVKAEYQMLAALRSRNNDPGVWPCTGSRETVPLAHLTLY
jgi:hypothetical protein